MTDQEIYDRNERNRLQIEAEKAAMREAEYFKMQEELMRQQEERKLRSSAPSVKQGTPASSKCDYTPPQLSDAEQFDGYGRPQMPPQRSEKKASPPKVI